MGVYIRNITKEQFIEDCNAMGILVITEGISEIDLVRCGECKWSYTDERDGLMWCKVHMSHYRVNADHFCSYGERRTDDNTIKANI